MKRIDRIVSNGHVRCDQCKRKPPDGEKMTQEQVDKRIYFWCRHCRSLN